MFDLFQSSTTSSISTYMHLLNLHLHAFELCNYYPKIIILDCFIIIVAAMKGRTSIAKQFPPPQVRLRNPSIQRSKQKEDLSPNKMTKKQKNKSVEYPKKRKASVEVKTKFQISPNHMGFLMEEQKSGDLAVIRASIALTHYYQSLLSLFAVIYSSSQIIASNLFEHKKQTTGLSGLRFIGILFSLYEFAWNQTNLSKLRVMAKNVMKMGSTTRIFEQKIEFVCRKITLNFNMQRRIQMAFLNTKLDTYWKSLLSAFKFTDQIQILEEMYETAPQKMAYWDFSFFVNGFLAEESFYETIKEANKLKRKECSEDDTIQHNFTYQFIIIQIFCFHQEEADREEESRNDSAKTCQLV